MQYFDCPDRRSKPGSSVYVRRFGILIVGALVSVVLLLLQLNAQPNMSRGQTAGEEVARPGDAQRWTQPQSGWLYVLDYNGMRDTSQILLVNPAKGATMGVIQTGYAPDMALSPDGKRLYIASRDSISVLWTETGIIETQFFATDRQVLLGATFPSMIVSPDNRWLLVMRMSVVPPRPASYALTVFDAAHANALASTTQMPGCGVGRLAWIGTNKLIVHCYESETLNIVTVDEAGLVALDGPPITFPPPSVSRRTIEANLAIRAARPLNVSVLPDGKSAVVFSGAGSVTRLDLVTRQAFPNQVGPRAGGWWIQAENWPRSADGRKIYLGTYPTSSRNKLEANEIEVFDTVAWQYTEPIETSAPFVSLTLSKDDRYLYGISSSKQKILVIDTVLGAEVGAVDIPARGPTLAIEAP